MIENIRDPMGWYVYFDDKGEAWRVHLTSSVAQAGLFLPAPADLVLKRWKHQRRMRQIKVCHVQTGHIDTIPVSTPEARIYNHNGFIDIAGRYGWQIVERIREKPYY